MKKLLVSVLAIAGLVACSQDTTLVQNSNSGTLMEFNVAALDNATRVDPSITLETLNGFDVWAYVDSKEGTVLTEERVSLVNGAWSYVNKQYWTPGHDYYFTAIAPVDTDIFTNNWAYDQAADEIDFTNVEGTEDLLLAQKTVVTPETLGESMEAVGLQFEHLLSKVRFTFKNAFTTDNVYLAVEDVKMEVPGVGTYSTVNGTWTLGEGNVTLAFGDATDGNIAKEVEGVEVFGIGEAVRAADERLTIPAAEDYIITFTVKHYNGDVLVGTYDKTSTVSGVTFEKGKAYNFVAEFTADNVSPVALLPIEFTVEGVNEWVEAGDNNYYEGETVVVANADELAAAIADPEVTAVVLADDINLGSTTITRAEGDVVIEKKSFTIDGAGKTLTYTGSNRVIDFVSSADVVKTAVFKDLTINITSSYCQRGINFNNTNGTIVIDNVKFVGTAPTYAINFPGSADGVRATIKNSSLVGNIALNVWGEDMVINVVDSELISVDKSTAEGYAAVKLNNDGATSAEGSVINIEGGKIIALDENGEPSKSTYNATDTGVIYVSESTEVQGSAWDQVAIVDYGTTDFYGMASLQDAIDKVAEDNKGKVRVTKDINLTEGVLIPAGATVEIDLNGHTITGVDNTNKNFEIIKNAGTLTLVGGGKITVEATVNSGWNRYSAVIANTVGGNLTVKGGVEIEHLGGTDMAYGIDNLTNGKGTSAVTTIEGATVKSPYRAVRQFLNGVEATNELYVKAGAILEGANKSIFFHDPSKNANTGKLVVEAGAQLKGDVYLFVTAGSTEWPVEVSIASSALVNGSQVLSGNVPAGYVVVEENGVWTVWDDLLVVSDAEAFATAMKSDAKNIKVALANDLDVAISSLGQQTGGSGEYKLGGENTESIYIDLNGKKLNITTTYWSVLGAKNDNALFTIKNGTMTSSQTSGTWNSYDLCFANCNYNFEDVVFEKAIALEAANKSYTLKNVSITETHDYYAIWVSAKGQNVTIDGLNIVSAGRGVKIDEQYVSAPAKVTMNVANATFKTAKKAAVVVKSVAGAEINWGAGNNIANVAADSVNPVWVDSDTAAYADKVVVNGASCVVEQ